MLGRPFFLAGCICLLATWSTLSSAQPLWIGSFFLLVACICCLILKMRRGRILFLGFIAFLSCFSVAQWQQKAQLLHSLNDSTVILEGVITDVQVYPAWIRYEVKADLFGDSFPMDLSSYDMELLPPGQRFRAQVQVESKDPRWQNGSKILEGRILSMDDLGEENSFSSACLRIRTTLLERMDQRFHGQGKEIISAILFGEKADLSPAVEQVFQKSGSTHILTVSGFHISILVGSIFAIINYLGIGPKAAATLLLPLIPFIALVEGSAVSIDRAAVMAFFYYIALILEKENDGLSIWGLAVLTALLPDPALVRSASFLLSYSAVLSILLFQAPINAWLKGFLRERHRYDIVDLQIFRILSAAATGLSANILIAPFLMIYFASIPLLTALSSLLLMPVLPLLMGLSILAILCPMELIARPLAMIAQLLAALLYRILALVGDLDLILYGQSELVMLGFLLLFAMLLFLYVKRASGREVRRCLRIGLPVFIVLCVISSLPSSSVEVTSCRRSLVLSRDGSALIIGRPERESDWTEIEKILHCAHVEQVELLLFSGEPRDDGLNALTFCQNWSPSLCQSTVPLDAFDLRSESYLASPQLSVRFWDDWSLESGDYGVSLSNGDIRILKTHREKLPQNLSEQYDVIFFDGYAVSSSVSLPWTETWDRQPQLQFNEKTQ